ncbi:hypothetical protein ACFOSD_14865 [Salinispirillum marinum]|uniref:DUF2975 domain-containing protein n=2 Tax=Saccharospirillaceae TaxID=255527 RepID=A0ABV8BHI1_9GAMM
METKQITAIAIRVLALWLLVHLVLSGSTLFVLFSTVSRLEQHELYPWVSIGFLALGLLAVVLLWRLSGKVLQSIEEDSQKRLPQGTQAFIIQLLGIYLLVTALVQLSRQVFMMPHNVAEFLQYVLPIVGNGMQGLIALALVAKANAWQRLLVRLRG